MAVAVNLLVERLLQQLSENVKLIKVVGDDFVNLLQQAQLLDAFLLDAEKYQNDSGERLIKDIQSVVYKAEAATDKFLVQAKLHLEKNIVARFFDLGHLSAVRSFAAESRVFIEKLRECRNISTFSRHRVLELGRKGVSKDPQVLLLEDNEVIGFDEQAEKVLNRLVEGSDELKVVPIVGMAGLGKSTLAFKIYNDPKLSYEVLSSIWLYVGQNYRIKEIILNIIKAFTKLTDEYQNMDMGDLCYTIREFIISKGGKCLIVLDDVWTSHVVDLVMNVFPENNKGHRIMLTTQDQGLALYTSEDPHYLKFLNLEESFLLLEKRVFGRERFPDELVRYGERIAEKCGGVPLVALAVARALRGRTSKSDWIRIEQNIWRHLMNKDDPHSCWKVIEMSFDHLPRALQTCFLYFGVFPHGFDIPSRKLIQLWIAEGLIKTQSSYTPEEIAEYCLNDLVNRNLVMVMQKPYGEIKTCRVHSMMHEFCKVKVTSGNFFQELCPTPSYPTFTIQDLDATPPRLCVQSSVLLDFLSTKPFAEHVRSFFCFSSKQKQKQIELSPTDTRLIQKAFPLIRVLDIESLKLFHCNDFKHLFHLRYIAISGDFSILPAHFGNLWNLQTLILNTSTSEPTLDIKAKIWNMSQLRHLHTNIPVKLPPPHTPQGEVSSLQTLSVVTPESCRKDVFVRVCHLKKLSIRGKMAAFLETNRGGISNLDELKCLKQLKLLNDVLHMDKALHLPPTFFRLVHTVTKLTLVNTRFAWSEADILGQMEALEVLKLKENAFTGESWKPEIGDFSQLRVLLIEMAELKTWEISNLNFPLLRLLVLISCDKLNGLPRGLADIPNLEEMRLENTSKAAAKSAKDILVSKRSRGIKFKLTISPPEITATH